MKEVNENEICEFYKNEDGLVSLREVGRKFNIDHHRVKRVLKRNKVEIVKENKKRELTEEHKNKISQSTKGRKAWNKGKTMGKEVLYKNMKAHLKYDVSLEWLKKYNDIEKLKFLNKTLTRKRVSKHFNTEKYKKFIQKFYYDKQFNNIYKLWLEEGKSKYFKPSLDHIVPKSRGGGYKIENLQFLTWFENRTKNNMTMKEWVSFKKENNTKSDLFIDNIIG